MPLGTHIEIQDVTANYTLPLPNEYEFTFSVPSVVGFNAVGKPFVQKLSDPGVREFSLTWTVLTNDELSDLRMAFEGLCSQVCRYLDVLGGIYSVVRHPGQKTIEAEIVKVAGDYRWAVNLRMLHTYADYEI